MCQCRANFNDKLKELYRCLYFVKKLVPLDLCSRDLRNRCIVDRSVLNTLDPLAPNTVDPLGQNKLPRLARCIRGLQDQNNTHHLEQKSLYKLRMSLQQKIVEQ